MLYEVITESGVGVLQALLDVTHGVGQGGLGVGVQDQALIDDHVRHLGTDQARQVSLDSLAQASQLRGSYNFV